VIEGLLCFSFKPGIMPAVLQQYEAEVWEDLCERLGDAARGVGIAVTVDSNHGAADVLSFTEELSGLSPLFCFVPD